MRAFFSVNVTYKIKKKIEFKFNLSSNSNYLQSQIIFEFATRSLNLKIYPRNDDAIDVGRKLDQVKMNKRQRVYL